MAERLTDKTPKTNKPANNDVIHIVDVDDQTGNTAGTSYKQTVEDFMKFAGMMLVNNTRVVKSSGNESLSQLQAGDTGWYIAPAFDRMVFFTVKVAGITIPADLDDSSKVAKWLDETPKL